MVFLSRCPMGKGVRSAQFASSCTTPVSLMDKRIQFHSLAARVSVVNSEIIINPSALVRLLSVPELMRKNYPTAIRHILEPLS